MRSPGIIVETSEGKKFIIYNNQPLLEEKGKVILHHIDDNMKLMNDDNGKPKISIRSVQVYNEEAQTYKVIGHVD